VPSRPLPRGTPASPPLRTCPDLFLLGGDRPQAGTQPDTNTARAVPTRCGDVTKREAGAGREGEARTKGRNKERRERRHGRESDASERGLGPGLWGVNLRHGTSAALVELRLLESDCEGSAIMRDAWEVGAGGESESARERANRAKQSTSTRSQRAAEDAEARGPCARTFYLWKSCPALSPESGSPFGHNQSSERCEVNLGSRLDSARQTRSILNRSSKRV
jgi:hypothetical protein